MDTTDWTLVWKVKYDGNRHTYCDRCNLSTAIAYRICPNYNYTAVEIMNVHKIGKLICEKCLGTYNPYIDMNIYNLYIDIITGYQINIDEDVVIYSETTARNIVYYRAALSQQIENMLPNRKL